MVAVINGDLKPWNIGVSLYGPEKSKFIGHTKRLLLNRDLSQGWLSREYRELSHFVEFFKLTDLYVAFKIESRNRVQFG